MAHLTTANLTKILDGLVSRPSWKVIMRSIGASESLAFHWRSQSIKAEKDNDRSSPFFLEWRGTWDYFHCHAGRARSENIITYEAQIRDQALNGIEVPVLGPDQRPIYRERPEYIGASDDAIRRAEGLEPWEDVRRLRLELDAKGRPIPLTKVEQIPAPLRLRVLEQDRNYIERKAHDVNVQGEITVQKPLARLPGEARPDLERLKQLAAMTPEQRRAALGASGVPLDKNGRRAMPLLAPPLNRDLPDDAGHGLKPGPAPFVRPQQPTPQEPPRPSYARPQKALDTGERTGDGRDIPPGGFRVA